MRRIQRIDGRYLTRKRAPTVFAYASFQASLAGATGRTFNMKCANTPVPAATDAVTDDAVNLAYTLGLSAATGSCLTASCINASATNKVRALYVVC